MTTTSDHGTKAEIANIDLERLAELMASTTAARGVDVYAVKGCGLSAAAWADMTDRDRSTVSRNVRRAQGAVGGGSALHRLAKSELAADP